MKSLKYFRNKADALLTPLIRSISPLCLLCGNPTQVAHHFVHKSKSSRLRYEMANLVPLCHRCHQRLHHNESYEAGRIIAIRGMEWFLQLERTKNEIVKTDRKFYEVHYEALLKGLGDTIK